jgi:RNA polymerase sigma-70 factor (ECF subfamily)
LDPTRESEIERVFRAEHGRAVAVLIRVFRDIDVAEEAVADAFAAAVQRWPVDGLPPSPVGWIITTARNRAIDRLRREASRADRHAQAALLHAGDEPMEEGPVQDERLRLIFTCCHPALSRGAQVALTRSNRNPAGNGDAGRGDSRFPVRSEPFDGHADDLRWE